MFEILTLEDRRHLCECRMSIQPVLVKVGQTVNRHLHMLEFRKLDSIVTHSKYLVKGRLAVVLERVGQFPRNA